MREKRRLRGRDGQPSYRPSREHNPRRVETALPSHNASTAHFPRSTWTPNVVSLEGCPFANPRSASNAASAVIATYSRSGVFLAYPKNWTLEEDSDEDAKINLTLLSPNTAFWTLIVYAERLDLEHAVSQVVEALRAEYPELETHASAEEIVGETLSGQDATFFCLDLTNTVRVRARHAGETTQVILCQSEDRELEEVDLVFQAITQSLLMGPPQADANDES